MVLDEEHVTSLTDDDFVAALCGAVLDGSVAAEPTGRARFQVAVTVCERCRQGWQEGAGVRVAIDAAAVDRAMCDAQHVGSLDGGAPERAHQEIPPSVVRLVWRRDGGRCRVPGCRSARGLEVHHIVHRADGGGHEAQNLVLLCSSCHGAHHRGALAIRGTAEHLEVRRPGEPVGASERRSARGSARMTCVTAIDQDGARVDAADLSGVGGTDVNAMSPLDQGANTEAAGISGCGAHVEVAGLLGRGAEAEAAGMPAGGAEAEAAGLGDGADVKAAELSASDDAHVGAAEPLLVREVAANHMDDADSRVGREDAVVRIRERAPVGSADPSGREGRVVRSSERGVVGAASVRARAGRRDANKLDEATLRVQAKTALTTMGWKPAIARAAVDAAIAAHGEDLPLGRLIFESLRRCPVRKG